MKISVKRTVTRVVAAKNTSAGGGGEMLVQRGEASLELREETSQTFDLRWEGKLLPKAASDRILRVIKTFLRKWFPWAGG